MSPRACLLACLPLLVSAGQPAPHWHQDLEAARKEARKRDRPLFVVFRCEH
jgi:hypothetical protein